MSDNRIAIRRALVSVYDKTGLEDLARGLHDAGVELVSTGGSAALIEGLGLPVTKVEELTGFPECLDGRVKTLHPRVHAGILADRRLDSHVAQLADLGVEPFDLVVSNLYPFSRPSRRARAPTSASSRSTSAARRWCAPPPRTTRRSRSSPRRDRYADVLAAVAAGGFTLDQRKRLAAEAFAPHRGVRRGRGVLDGQRARRHLRGEDGFPAWAGATWEQVGRAALRREPAPGGRALRRRLGGGLAGGRAAARQGDVLQQLRRHRRGPAGGVRLRPSRPWRSSSTPTRAASRSAPTSPRRTAGRTRATRSRRSAA